MDFQVGVNLTGTFSSGRSWSSGHEARYIRLISSTGDRHGRRRQLNITMLECILGLVIDGGLENLLTIVVKDLTSLAKLNTSVFVITRAFP